MGYEVGYASDKQKFPPHKTRKAAIIDHRITTRRAGAELLYRVKLVQSVASSTVARPPHVRLVLVQ
jgi:hypothetical protein